MSDLANKIADEFKIIGRNKYQYLKSFNFDEMDEFEMVDFREKNNYSVTEAIKQLDKYEKKNSINQKPTKEVEDYLKTVLHPIKQKKSTMTKEWLYNSFKQSYLKNEGTSFNDFNIVAGNGNDTKKINSDVINNIKPLIYYFIGDFENFKKCENLSKISEPSLDKGLLIIGGYGNGKTSIMRALEDVLKTTNVSFKGFTANEIVKIYEQANNPLDKAEFDRITSRGTRYFDDILTERQASNYGKQNLFKDIFEERYNKGRRTYISCNYLDENIEKGISKENLNMSLIQFGEKYGSRVYDRLFAMFNIIEFKGRSFRK